MSQFSRSVVSDSLRPPEPQHARPPCPSPTPRFHSNSCPSSRWCHPAISSSVVPFSSCPQSLPVSGSFPTSQLFAWGGQSIEISASASVLPMNKQDWSPLGWTLIGIIIYSAYCRLQSVSSFWPFPFIVLRQWKCLATFQRSQLTGLFLICISRSRAVDPGTKQKPEIN